MEWTKSIRVKLCGLKIDAYPEDRRWRNRPAAEKVAASEGNKQNKLSASCLWKNLRNEKGPGRKKDPIQISLLKNIRADLKMKNLELFTIFNYLSSFYFIFLIQSF